jgi:hypothetical protein
MNRGPAELDEYLAPTNMTTAELLAEPPEPAPAVDPNADPNDPATQKPKPQPKRANLHAI